MERKDLRKDKQQMSRRKRSPRREVSPDAVYQDVTLARFIRKVMLDGKRNCAEKVVYQALDIIKEKISEEPPLTVFKKAIENTKPSLEVRSRRIGGATYQVPIDVRPNRRLTLAMRWLVGYARKRGEKSMGSRIAGELMDAYNGRGTSIKKREDVHKMAEANKAFSHFNW